MSDSSEASHGPSFDGGGGRMSRRRLLLQGALVAPGLVLAGWLARSGIQAVREPRASVPPTSPRDLHTRFAARAASAGDMKRARKEVAAALADVPSHPPALLVLACIALEEGNFHEAQAVVAQLEAAAPGRLEPVFLRKLCTRRQQAPSAGWAWPFLETWMELGSPDLESSPFLPEEVSSSPDGSEVEAAWRSTTSPRAQLFLGLALPELSEEQGRWLLRQVPTLEEPALFIAVFDTLSRKSRAAPLREEAAPVLHQRLSRLTGAYPRSMQLRLLRLLAGTEAGTPLGAQELDALDAISMLPAWREESFSSVFLEARHHLREAGIAHSNGRAFAVAQKTMGYGGPYLLRKRVEATREQLSEDARRGLGKILWRVGSCIAEASSYLEHTVGLLLMELGAEDMDHGGSLADVYARQEELSASIRASYKVALERWPSYSLLDEIMEARARNEVVYLRAFLGKAALP